MVFNSNKSCSFFLVLFLFAASGLSAQADQHVSGIVFHDVMQSGFYDQGVDVPLEGVAVSNGREITLTGSDGKYSLPLRDNSVIFVIKPRNYQVPVDENQMPDFYYIHSTTGLSGTRYEGLPPTGEIPHSVDFPLYSKDEPGSIKVLVFGDTQPRNEQEIHYLMHDALAELVSSDAAFGVTLGDIVFDNLDLFEFLYSSISVTGIPWRYVLGNHDLDFTADTNKKARGKYKKHFGPSYYSFSHGPAHFIVLDNIRWIVEDGERYYRTGLGVDQMEFLRAELERIGSEMPVFLMAHIPWAGSTSWEDENEQQELFGLLARYPNTVSLVSHHHRHYHHFLGEEHGFSAEQPHHMICVATVCGSWWNGMPDEYGIPHALMTDGTPTSYTYLHIRGNDWKLRWKASRRPESYQMNIHAPEAVNTGELSDATVTANIFNALPDARVRMRIGREEIDMERVNRQDPVNIEAYRLESLFEDHPWRSMSHSYWEGHVSEYLWEGKLPLNLEPGVHVIHVMAEDDWWEYEGKRIIRVIE